MIRLMSCALMVGCLVCGPGVAQEAVARPALRGFDPVELSQGKEVAGRAEWSAAYGRYHYQFASKENRAAFEKEPRRYAIQIAGACARMGPLCGAGSPDRFVVHDQRIFIFASDACRSTFEKAPAKHIDLPDAVPTGSDADRAEGRRLLDLAAKGFGGADKLAAVKNLQFTLPRSYGAGKDKVEGNLTTTLVFPGQLRHDENWGAWTGAHALSGPDSFDQSSKGFRSLEDVEREYLTREFYRHPVAIIHARQQPGFVTMAAGKGKVGERDVNLVKAAFAGATCTLSIDPETGRVLAVAYRGRPGIGSIGAIEKTFNDFKQVEGVVLPHTVHVTWEGKQVPTYSGAYSAVRVSIELPSDFLRATKAK